MTTPQASTLVELVHRAGVLRALVTGPQARIRVLLLSSRVVV